MATPWDDLEDAEIAVDADVTALLLKKYRNRDEYMREVLSAAVGADRINAGAIETVGFGTGSGLTTSHFNRLEATGSTVVNVGATVPVNTGIAGSTTRAPLAWVKADTGTGKLYITLYLSGGSGSGSIYVELQRIGGTNGTVDWKCIAIAE